MAASTATANKSDGLQELVSILFGRFMLPDMSEHPCQVARLSADGAVFLTSSVPPPGQSIVAYINEIGRVEATTGEPTEDGFIVTFVNTGARRERIEERIRWLQENQGGSSAQRRHARFEPRDTKSHLTLPDGRTYPCEVIDISLSGAAIKIDVMPALGTYLYLGKMRGRVVRYHEAGIAIEFTRQLERSALAEHVR